jgi:hypothetical protein
MKPQSYGSSNSIGWYRLNFLADPEKNKLFTRDEIPLFSFYASKFRYNCSVIRGGFCGSISMVLGQAKNNTDSVKAMSEMYTSF